MRRHGRRDTPGQRRESNLPPDAGGHKTGAAIGLEIANVRMSDRGLQHYVRLVSGMARVF